MGDKCQRAVPEHTAMVRYPPSPGSCAAHGEASQKSGRDLETSQKIARIALSELIPRTTSILVLRTLRVSAICLRRHLCMKVSILVPCHVCRSMWLSHVACGQLCFEGGRTDLSSAPTRHWTAPLWVNLSRKDSPGKFNCDQKLPQRPLSGGIEDGGGEGREGKVRTCGDLAGRRKDTRETGGRGQLKHKSQKPRTPDREKRQRCERKIV